VTSDPVIHSTTDPAAMRRTESLLLAEEADVVDVAGGRPHRRMGLAVEKTGSEHPQECQRRTVRIELGVEAQRTRGRIGIALGRRDPLATEASSKS